MTDTQPQIIAALQTFVEQKPRLDPREYIRGQDDHNGRRAYQQDARSITAALRHAKRMLTVVRSRSYTPAQWSLAFKAYSGRLSWDGQELGYCTGQYFRMEYRQAVCAVLASLLWNAQDGDKRSHFRQQFGA